MAKASALLVGLKSVDPTEYNGWDGTGGCWGCELDVDNIERILTPFGYNIKTLKTAQATRDRILASLYRAAENVKANDIFSVLLLRTRGTTTRLKRRRVGR